MSLPRLGRSLPALSLTALIVVLAGLALLAACFVCAISSTALSQEKGSGAKVTLGADDLTAGARLWRAGELE